MTEIFAVIGSGTGYRVNIHLSPPESASCRPFALQMPHSTPPHRILLDHLSFMFFTSPARREEERGRKTTLQLRRSYDADTGRDSPSLSLSLSLSPERPSSPSSFLGNISNWPSALSPATRFAVLTRILSQARGYFQNSA